MATMAAIALMAATLAPAPAQAAELSAIESKAQTCLACHGAAGISQMPEVPSLAGQTESYLQWQLVYLRAGTRKSALMQPMAAGLSDDDIRDLSRHFAAMTPPQPPAVDDSQAAMYSVGQHLAQQNHCASCHTDSYTGVKAAPRTALQREDYLLKSLRDYKAGTRTGGGVAAMSDVVYPLGDDELRALAHFMSHLR